jgi:AraC family transcriptional activator FtrA
MAAPPAPLVETVRRAHARGARVASICSGVFVLAAAGLLDGRSATAHWMYTNELASRYPRVKVDCDVLYVDHGDVLTSAGTAAAVDLCLHLVRSDHGSVIANAVARLLVVPPHREGGQAQYIDHVVPSNARDSLASTFDRALAHLDQPITVADLARRAHVSPRTLARRFQSTTGTSPLRWLLQQRIRRAQELLETTDHPVERIATWCGFGSAANFRQHFTRMVRTSPQAYRRTFRALS